MRSEGPRAVPYLPEVLDNSRNEGVCKALGEIGDKRAVGPLSRILLRDMCLPSGRSTVQRALAGFRAILWHPEAPPGSRWPWRSPMPWAAFAD